MNHSCALADNQILSAKWIENKLTHGCNCADILDQNAPLSVHCEPFPFNHDIPVQIFYILAFSATILSALCGNLTVIWIVLRHQRMRTVTNYYLLNLAIADATISIFNTGFSWSYNLYYVWVFGPIYCSINNLMGIVPICASVFTMILMSIDRYMALVHPLKKRLKGRQTIFSIVTIWIIAIICGLPTFFASKQEFYYFIDGINEVFAGAVCLADNFPDGNAHTSNLYSMYNTALTTINYVLPLFVLIFTYGSVAIALRKSESIGDYRNLESVKAKRKASNMLALIVIIFMFLWLPYQLYFTVLHKYLVNAVDRRTLLHIYLNIYWLGMSSTIFNPIIYCVMNERFRLGFRYAFRWLPCVTVNMSSYETILQSQRTPATLFGGKLKCRQSVNLLRRSFRKHFTDFQKHFFW